MLILTVLQHHKTLSAKASSSEGLNMFFCVVETMIVDDESTKERD